MAPSGRAADMEAVVPFTVMSTSAGRLMSTKDRKSPREMLSGAEMVMGEVALTS